MFPIGLLAWSGAVGTFYPIGLNLLGSDFAHPDRARVNAAYVMTYALGMMLGPPLIGAGLDLHPPSGLFWAMAALIATYAAVFGGWLLARRFAPLREG